MQFPHIDPILLQIGPLAIRWYALGYIFGILLGWWYCIRLAGNERLWRGPGPMNRQQIDDFCLWVSLGVIVGGRVGSVLIYNTSTIWTEPLEIFKVWHGGMSFHGGLIGVVIAAFAFALKNRLDVIRVGDLVAPCTVFGLLFVRLGNFINGELWGRPTNVPWAMVFPEAGPEPRHPSQLYEAALEGIVIGLVLRWATHHTPALQRRGLVAGLFFVLYALFRIFVEFFREPDRWMPHLPFGVTTGMLLCVPMLVAGAVLVSWSSLRPQAPAAASTTERGA